MDLLKHDNFLSYFLNNSINTNTDIHFNVSLQFATENPAEKNSKQTISWKILTFSDSK